MKTGKKSGDLRIQYGMTLGDLGNKLGDVKSIVRKQRNRMIANMRKYKITKLA